MHNAGMKQVGFGTYLGNSFKKLNISDTTELHNKLGELYNDGNDHDYLEVESKAAAITKYKVFLYTDLYNNNESLKLVHRKRVTSVPEATEEKLRLQDIDLNEVERLSVDLHKKCEDEINENEIKKKIKEERESKMTFHKPHYQQFFQPRHKASAAK